MWYATARISLMVNTNAQTELPYEVIYENTWKVQIFKYNDGID